MSVWRTWSRLSGSERGLLLSGSVIVVAVRVALWVLPSRWIIRWVSRIALPTVMPRPLMAVEGQPSANLNHIIWAVDAASRRVPDASCLTQAVAALLLMRRHGYAARFCVGVARAANGSLDAHAWLEREGRVLIGRVAQPFVRLPDLAPARSDAQLT